MGMLCTYLVICLMLLPSSLQSSPKLQWCKKRVVLKRETTCLLCMLNQLISCPIGYNKTSRGVGISGCWFQKRASSLRGENLNFGRRNIFPFLKKPSSIYFQRRTNKRKPQLYDSFSKGCYHTCTRDYVLKECCPGYWGSNCIDCPGGAERPCSASGKCLDGKQGNGTCLCKPHFSGTACELCSSPNFYGANCTQECLCVHGVCQSGPTGDGQCICNSGYVGQQCDNAKPECLALKCHKHAHCVSKEGALACRCRPGFSGNGKQCQEINPCETQVCDPHANCEYLGPGSHSCHCQPGYRGDGRVCMAVDPCVEPGHGGCPVNSTLCVYYGPGKSYCKCWDGYENLQAGIGCRPIDVCKTNNTCHTNADCFSTRGTIECICRSGYVGDGQFCYGSLTDRLEKLNTGFNNRWNGRLSNSILLFNKGLQWVLNNLGPFTIFVPVDQAFRNIDVNALLANTSLATYISRVHIVPGEITMKDLQAMDSLYSLTGDVISILHRDKDQMPFLNFPASCSQAKILQSDIVASNGLMHLIDCLASGTQTLAEAKTQRLLSVILKYKQFSHFQALLENSGISTMLEGQWTASVFLPTNDAIDRMRDGRLNYLFTPQARYKLEELVKHHIVPAVDLDSAKLCSLSKVMTMAQQYVPFNVSRNGRIHIDGIPVLHTDVQCQNGRLTIIDGVLLPQTILPILPHRCEKTTYRIQRGQCIDCSGDKKPQCPLGALSTVFNKTSCFYAVTQNGLPIIKSGCALYCNQTIVTPTCCKGFHGPDCLPCPGGFVTPCYGHGQCVDGHEGNGTCLCRKAFVGSACHVCARPDRHGPNCDLKCPCLHGECDNRPGSGGACRIGSCQQGLMGQLCDRSTVSCGPSGRFCHVHAECQSREGDLRCVCKPGYRGDGATCEPFNPCNDPGNGGCHSNADCFSSGNGQALCTCIKGWTGDGRECYPIDNCQMPDKGNCHPNASCIYIGPGQSECRCSTGYRGDGMINCNPIDLCLENNGGCHLLATCKSAGLFMRHCTCPRGYGGNGVVCFGSLMTELTSHEEFRHVSALISDTSLKSLLTSSANFTVLIPSAAALKGVSKDDETFWMEKSHFPYILKFHMLRGALTTNDLTHLVNGSLLPTLLDKKFHLIELGAKGITVAGASFNLSDVKATNGIIHIIDKVLIPDQAVTMPTLPNLHTRLSQTPQFFTFHELLVEYTLLKDIESAAAYTIFVPTEEAMDLFRKGRPTHPHYEQVKYHVILGARLSTKDFIDGMHRPSMLGPSFQLAFFHREKQLYVNNVPVTDPDIQTSRGVLHGIGQVLPVQRNRCDSNDTKRIPTKCNHCLFPPPKCSSSSSMLLSPKFKRRCIYFHYLFGKAQLMVGCRYICIKTLIMPDCCDGYFGKQCLPCPGTVDAWCNDHGVCSDGLNGTGQCICEEGFGGTACEQCLPDRYGKQCQQDCLCVKGRCQDGLSGDGSCECNVGYRGIHCDKPITNNACKKTCHTSANCIENPGQIPKCVCAAGFTGNGTSCTGINACETENGGCSKYAICHRTKPGLRNCVCMSGFTGDGVICLEIDPCRENNGGCDKNAECTHIGPNKAVCNCLEGYTGNDKSCEPINPCKANNGGCSPFAKCNHTGPGIATCACFQNYIGDGYTCKGTILQVLSSNTGESSVYLKMQVSRIADLSGPGPYTVLIPNHKAFVTDRQLVNHWSKSGQMLQILRHHIVACSELFLIDLQDKKQVRSIHGDLFHLTSSAGGMILNGNAHIVKSDQMASNGVIHVIDRILVPDNLQVFGVDSSTTTPNFTQMMENEGFNTFAQLLQVSGLLALLNDPLHQPFTIFLPTDTALQQLPEAQKESLLSMSQPDMLQEVLKYHVIQSSKVSASDLFNIHELVTMQGSVVTVTCSSGNVTGEVLVGEAAVRMVRSQLEFRGGVAHAIDSLLEPPSIGGRCDLRTSVTIMGDCGRCTDLPPCPKNSKPKDVQACTSRFYFAPIKGCQQICDLSVHKAQCCKGFYGKHCHACPGGTRNPCGGHGTCDDGLGGTGNCTCPPEFNGTACELCLPGRYGSSCAKCECTKNGVCNEGIQGTGFCFCNESWTGKRCETKLERPPQCNPKCHRKAICTGNNTCQCWPFYVGDGLLSCKLVQRCLQRNGGCHLKARCIQKGILVRCKCLQGFKGDGRVCRPQDLCVDGNNGGCSEHASCKNTGPKKRSCTCHADYVGDGEQCLLVQTAPVNRCLQNNGACSAWADCTDLHHVEQQAGVYHAQSQSGRYQTTYKQAESRCAEDGATLATFDQLSRAQQTGLHMCSVGWLQGQHAAYPTSYSNPSCGFGKIGIIDYGLRNNASELWDAFCFRVKEVKCVCKDGFVGDGYSCNGDFVQVLSLSLIHQRFYAAMLEYSNSSETGHEFLRHLSNPSTNFTVFLPLDEGFGDNETLSSADLEHHVVESDIVLYSELDNGTQLLSRQGSPLIISVYSDHPLEKAVNDRAIVVWDVFVLNAVIHYISGPLRAPVMPPMKQKGSAGTGGAAVAVVLVLLLLLIAALAGVMFTLREKSQYISFIYRVRGVQELLISGDRSCQSLVNPVYTEFSSQADEPPPLVESDKEQLVYVDGKEQN